MLVITVISILISLSSLVSTTDKIVCYYGSWSIYRNGNGKFGVQNIDPKLCTHAIYTFVGLNYDGTIRLLDSYNDIDLAGFEQFSALRLINPNLKTLVAIGGWNEGSETYSQVVADPKRRQVFVQEAVRIVSTYNFDGFDLDWEYPGQRGGSPEDAKNYSKLLRELRQAFDQYGFLLTAAVAASAKAIDISYEVPVMASTLDFINVMTYDIHGSWDQVTGMNAPLYPSSYENGGARDLNVRACIHAWMERGAPPEKLVLGIPVYGRSFTLASSSNSGIGAPAYGPGKPGPYTGESGMLGYNEICEMQLNERRWNIVWDDEQKVPYMHLDNEWIGYDDPRSVSEKVEFAKSLNLGGIMIWSLETDDFLGVCGPRYPILHAINHGLNKNISVEENTPFPPWPPTTSVTNNPHTTAPSIEKPTTCEREGYFRDPINCAKFYYCHIRPDNSIEMSAFECGPGLAFDDELLVCNYYDQVKC